MTAHFSGINEIRAVTEPVNELKLHGKPRRHRGTERCRNCQIFGGISLCLCVSVVGTAVTISNSFTPSQSAATGARVAGFSPLFFARNKLTTGRKADGGRS